MTDGNRLRLFVERVERIEAEIKDLNGDKRDIFAEAKAAEYDAQAIKDLVRYRRDPDKAQGRSARFEEYLALFDSRPQKNEPARSFVAAKGHPESPSRARARGDETGERSATPTTAHSAPVAAEAGAVKESAATSELVPEFLCREPDDPVWRQ